MDGHPFDPPAPPPERLYPLLNCLVKLPGLMQPWHYVTENCFHDLFEAHEGELAGMGLAIIGNLMTRIHRGTLSTRHEARLELVLAPGDLPIRCPWPGLPDDRELILDYAQLPWDSVMFLDPDAKFKYRMNRLLLMHRIQTVWVPWLLGKLQRFPGWAPTIERVRL